MTTTYTVRERPGANGRVRVRVDVQNTCGGARGHWEEFKDRNQAAGHAALIVATDIEHFLWKDCEDE